jgi:ribosomal protein S18 acetylase RimI-like enzyme
MSYAAISYHEVAQSHLAGIVEICRAEGWESFCDPSRVWRVLTAPGVSAAVALDGERVVGFAYVQSDGEVQAHLSNIAVTQSHRRRGIARQIIEEAFGRCGAKRIDLVSSEGAEKFYRSFQHREFPGFRIYPDRRN